MILKINLNEVQLSTYIKDMAAGCWDHLEVISFSMGPRVQTVHT